MALGKGAYAIHQSGKWYTNNNIDQMLMERHLNKKARRSSHKNHIKGPKKRTEEDDVRFAQSFEKMLMMVQEKFQKNTKTMETGRCHQEEGFVQNEFTDRDEFRCFLLAVSGIYRIQ